LYDRLEDRFGRDQVFRDLDSLTYGTEFLTSIRDAVSSCDSLVAVIGREWSTVSHSSGGRRLDDPRDFVRLEIAAALERSIPVIPVLVEDAVMPDEDELPVPLIRLSRYNGLAISDSRWDYDVDRLLTALERWTPPAQAAAMARTALPPPVPSAPVPPQPPVARPAPVGPPTPSPGLGWLKIAIPIAALAVVGVVLAVVLGGGNGGGGTEGALIAEADVVVPGTQPWTDTSLQVAPGNVVSVTANGQIRDDVKSRPLRVFGPDGLDDFDSRKGDPSPATKHVALIGRVGNDQPFALGAQGERRVGSAGTLLLGTNDGFFGDNDGSFTVHVRIRQG